MTADAETIGLDIATTRKRHLRTVERTRRLRALALVLPLFLFIIVSFVIPIGTLLWNAVYDPSIRQLMPQSVAALEQWDGMNLPDEAAFVRPG
jgi:putative spermidine/putrescine transport system permease protein